MLKNSKATTSTVKSAAVVGDVMKWYHAHGDSSIYMTIKPLANWFETYIPLIFAKRFPHPRAQIPFHHYIHRAIKWRMIIAAKPIGNFGYVQDIPFKNPIAVLVF